MDMHSGGGSKEKWEYIYIEAPAAEARVIFYNRFGHNPDRVSCTCCGEDYSVSEAPSLADATAYERNCQFDRKENRYVERQDPKNLEIRAKCDTKDTWGLYVPVENYIKSEKILVIYAKDIKPNERRGDVPRQGYVYV